MDITQSPINAKLKEGQRPEARTSSCTSEQQSHDFSFLLSCSGPMNFTFFFSLHFPPENCTSFRRNLLSDYSVTQWLAYPFRSSRFLGQTFPSLSLQCSLDSVQSEPLSLCLVCHLWGWRQSLWHSLLIPEVQQILYIRLIYFSRLVGLIYGAL